MLKAACIILFIGLATSETSINSVISRLLDQAKSSKSRSPLILVINSQALEESSSSVEAPVETPFRQTAEENGISLMTILTQLSKARQNPTVYRSRPRFTSARKPQKRHPVYKSLLSLRNSLRCGARDECKDECEELPKPKKKKCNKKCEKKYDCDEEPKCEESDECNGDASTKGPPPDSEEPTKCPRC